MSAVRTIEQECDALEAEALKGGEFVGITNDLALRLVRTIRARDVSAQKVMIVQIPSEANAERLINERVNEANADGRRIVQMMDHNGFLVLLLERRPESGDSG